MSENTTRYGSFSRWTLRVGLKLLGRTDDPPMTRFVAEQMAKDHFFDISAAQDDLGYLPETPMPEALERTIVDLKLRGF